MAFLILIVLSSAWGSGGISPSDPFQLRGLSDGDGIGDMLGDVMAGVDIADVVVVVDDVVMATAVKVAVVVMVVVGVRSLVAAGMTGVGGL